MNNCDLTLDNGGQGCFHPCMDNQTLSNGEPPKSNCGKLPVPALVGEPTNAQILSDLNRAKCAFQLAAICAAMGIAVPDKQETLK